MFYKLLGMERGALVNLPFPRFIFREDADIFYLRSKALFETCAAQACDLRLLKADGEQHVAWVHLDMTPAQGSDSELVSRVTLSDISEGKGAERMLQHAHDELELRVAERTDELRKEIIERKQAEYQTKERLKELQAFYSLAEITEKEGITLENLFQELADVLPKSWQYPEIACARIVMGDREFCTENFTESAWMLSAPVTVNRAVAGSLKVGYLEEKPTENEGPFLKEERLLIDAIAERIGRITENKQAAEKLQKSEASLKAIFENSALSILFIDINRKIQFFNKVANERAVITFGKEIHQGDSIYEMVIPRDRDDFDRDFQCALNGDLVRTEKSFTVGAVKLCYEFHYAPVRMDGQQVIGVFFSVIDITERKQVEEALLASEERYRTLFQQASDGIFYLSTDFKIVEINASFARMHGYRLEEMQNMRLQDLDTPETFRLTPDRLRRALAGEAINFEVEHYHKDGHVFPLAVSLGLISVDGKNIIQAFHRDITARKAAEEKIRLLNIELEKLVATDYLTNLYNQRYFMQRGADEFKRTRRNSQPLALMMLDIDEFKKINDTFGHGVGDLVLQQVARILKSSLREIDPIGRLGGDEFAVLLPDTCLEDAVALAERACQTIANSSFETADQILSEPITMSIGVATITDGMSSIDDLLKNADAALYRAKHSGRNCVAVHQGNPEVPLSKITTKDKNLNTFENYPDWILKNWQVIADLLAEIIGIPAALIMKTENEFMEVFISSHSENNPYPVGAKEKWSGLYCETVIKTQNKLLVPNALKDKKWARFTSGLRQLYKLS